MLYALRSVHADNDEQFHVFLCNYFIYFSFFFFSLIFERLLFAETDTISERDFACPPKRRKQDENDEDVVLRKSALNDDYKYRIDLLEPSQNDAFTKR